MILGSHNSWSYLPPTKWWMKPIAFMARCQSMSIREQYEAGVRCFDLRVRFSEYGLGIVAHGIVEYCYTASRIYEDLAWLNEQGGCYVRVIHEVRTEKQYKNRWKYRFKHFCSTIEHDYKYIHFWCGRELYCWCYEYRFGGVEPSCDEKYSSVCPPRLLAWWPWLWAKIHNRDVLEQGTDMDILLIDFVKPHTGTDDGQED